MPTNKTIAISLETKEKLDQKKVHPRETYDDVIKRLIEYMNQQELTSP
jgi:predicted CopG family antitoxin